MREGAAERRFSLLAAVGLGLIWSINSADYSHTKAWFTILLFVGFIAAALVVRDAPIAGRFTLFYACAVGVADRVFRPAMLYVSDVIDATREALIVLFSGHNPYLHYFMMTRPMGSPFPYLPGELLFYGIPYAVFHSINEVDRAAGIATIFVLAAAAPLVGIGRASLCVALYAGFKLAAWDSVEGSNDGSLALLIASCAVCLAWKRETASAVLLGWALAYKPFAWPFLPFITLYVRSSNPSALRPYVGIALGVAGLLTLPFLFPSPGGLIGNVYHGFVFHAALWGMNAWTALLDLGAVINPFASFITLSEVGTAILVFVLLLRAPVPSVGRALFYGLAVIAAALGFAHWSTDSYYTFAGTLFITALSLEERLDGGIDDTP